VAWFTLDSLILLYLNIVPPSAETAPMPNMTISNRVPKPLRSCPAVRQPI